MTTIATKKPHDVDVDATNPARAVHGWNPLQSAPGNASPAGARRVFAMRHATYENSAEVPEARETYAAPASAAEAPIQRFLRLVSIAIARRDGARMRTDFNARLIERSLDREACASLGSTLQCLLAAGLLVRHSQDEYSLTQAGLAAMAREKCE